MFRIPAGDAKDTLRLFAEQSGEQIVYLIDKVRGQRTRALQGRYTPLEALERMLADTRLLVRRDETTGAMTVVRRPSVPAPPVQARSARSEPAPAPAVSDDIVELSAFTVSVHAADRYRVSDAISAVRVRAPLINTPSSISVITRDTIDDVSPTRIFDVTRYIAGIEDGRGIQFSDRQIIRGYESNGRTVDNFIQTGADNYEEALVERIEISKGPNAILSPAGVPGGSINVITKSPSFVPRRTLTGIAGRFDAQKITLDATGPLPTTIPLAYRLIASAQDTRRYWGDDIRLRRKALAPMLTWRLSDRTQLTLKLVGTEQWSFREPALIVDPGVNLGTRKPSLAPGFSSKGRNGIQPWSHVGTEIIDGSALLTSSLNERVSTRFAVNARRYFEDSKQQFLQTPSLIKRYHPATGVLTPDHVWEVDPATRTYSAIYSPLYEPHAIPVRGDIQETTLTSHTVQHDVVFSARGDRFSAQTVAGWATSNSDQTGRLWSGTLPPISLLAPLARHEPQWQTSPYADHRTRIRNWQIYANQRLGFFSDHLLLTAGVMHYDVSASFVNRVGDNANRLNVLDDSNLMWLGSVLVKPREDVSLYYSYSTNSSPTIVNDRPIWRDGQQHELGVKTEWFGQRLAANLAWFRIRQTNVSVPNPERQTNLEATEHLLADLGDHGVELEIAGGLTDNLSILAAHTELRLRDYLGRRVRAVADRNSALLLNYRFRTGLLNNLSLTLGVIYAGERIGDTTPVDITPLGVITQPSFRIPAYTIVNVGAAYRWKNYRFRLNVDNVFDDSGYLQQAGGRVSGTGLSTAPGINVKISAMVEF
jgi:iron complex outermembrane recepter protein